MHPRLLTIVLLPTVQESGTDSQDNKKYATIRFPGSYQTAVDTALKAFKRHMSPNAKPEDVELLTLRPVQDADGMKLVWSVLDAADWNLVVSDEVPAEWMLAIRELKAEESALKPDEKHFIIGYTGLSYGTVKNGVTSWTSISGIGESSSPKISRPKSYHEAIEFVKAACTSAQTSTDNARYTIGRLDLNAREYKFKFYKFFAKDQKGKVVTDLWIDIPEIAHYDDAVWRQYAPDPSQNEALGFTLQELPVSEKYSYSSVDGAS